MKNVDRAAIVTELNEIVEHAAIQPAYWHDLVDRMRRYFPEAKVVFQAIDRQAKKPLPFAFAGWSETTVKNYGDYYGAINPWRQAWLDMPFLITEWSDDYLRNSELRKSEYYEDMLRPEGECDSGSGVKIFDEDDRLAILSANYAYEKGESMHRRLAPVMQSIVLPMRRALDANRLLGQVVTSRLMEGQILQAICDAAFVVDRNCRVLAANQPAHNLIDQGELVRTDLGGRASFTDARANLSFSAVAGALCGGVLRTENRHSNDFVALVGDQRFRVTLVPISPGQLNTDRVLPLFLPRRAALVIVRPELMPSPGQLLNERYGLTKTQIAVTIALSEGSALADIAGRFGMSYETARSHLRAIFNKTGVSKQAELVALTLRLSA